MPAHFPDRRIREAIAIAREAIGQGLYAGQTTPACCYWVVEGNVGYPGDVDPHPYDPERAAKLVKDADFEGAEIEIMTFSGDADFVDQPGLSEAVAGYLEAIGLNSFVSIVDGPVLRETFDNAIKTPEEIEEIVANQPPYQIAVRGNDTRLHSYRGDHIYYHYEGRRQMMRLPEILDPLLDEDGCDGYELAASLNFDGDGDVDGNVHGGAYWNSGAGWTPIGNDNTIANLLINESDLSMMPRCSAPQAPTPTSTD